MHRLLFITHPEVAVDPTRPVPRWHLSETGIRRMRLFAESREADGIAAIWASTETKAIEAAGILAARHGLGVNVAEDLGENDRSATGFLPPPDFEAMADAFFARPHESIRGWERAADAQARIVAATGRILATHRTGDIAIVAHGGVGTLLLSHFRREPISRAADQPFQGHFWTAALPECAILHPWRPIAPRHP